MKPIVEIIWLEEYERKLLLKHNVEAYEVEEVFNNNPRFRFVEKGLRQDEHKYKALGQTDSGRYLVVFFILKTNGGALIVSGRDMADKERKAYERK